MRKRLSRAVAPASSSTCDRLTARQSARASTRAALARPSSGGAVTAIFSAPPQDARAGRNPKHDLAVDHFERLQSQALTLRPEKVSSPRGRDNICIAPGCAGRTRGSVDLAAEERQTCRGGGTRQQDTVAV